jgi:hypothetical protein
MNSPLAQEQHSSTAAEALSLLLGIRYSSNQLFTQLQAQDSEVFHNNIKLTSNDLYISISELGDARLAVSSTKIFGCTSIIYEMKKEVRDFNLRMIEKERLEHSIQCFPLDEQNVQFLKDKLHKFSSLGSNLVVHFCLNSTNMLNEFTGTVQEILKTGVRVITQHPVHFENLPIQYLFSETVLYNFFGENPFDTNNTDKNVERKFSQNITIPRWRANCISSKIPSNDLYKLCKVELDRVINYVNNYAYSNQLPGEKNALIKRKKLLEKDLNIFETVHLLAHDSFNNNAHDSTFRTIYNHKRINRTGIVLNHLQQYSTVSGNLECEVAYSYFLAFKTILHTYNFNDCGPSIINNPTKPISNEFLNIINDSNNISSSSKNINIFSSSYRNPNLIIMEDLVANGTVALVDMIMDRRKFNGIILNPPTSTVLKTLNLKESWPDHCTSIISTYLLNKYPKKVKKVAIVNLHSNIYDNYYNVVKKEQENNNLENEKSKLIINLNYHADSKKRKSNQHYINIPIDNNPVSKNNVTNYLYIWDRIVLPKVREFDPDVILFDTTIGCETSNYLSNLLYPLLGLANGRLCLFLEQQPLVMTPSDDYSNSNGKIKDVCKCIINCLNVFDGCSPPRISGIASTPVESNVTNHVDSILLALDNDVEMTGLENTILTTKEPFTMASSTLEGEEKEIHRKKVRDIEDDVDEHFENRKTLQHDIEIELEDEIHV